MRLDAHGLTWRNKSEDGFFQCIVDVGELELCLVAVPVNEATADKHGLRPLSSSTLYTTPENRISIDGEDHVLLITAVSLRDHAQESIHADDQFMNYADRASADRIAWAKKKSPEAGK